MIDPLSFKNWKILLQNKCYTKSNRRIYELYYSITSKERWSIVKSRLPLAFIDSVHFLNISLINLVKKLEKKTYHINQEFNAYVLDLLKKKGIFLKKSKKDYTVKTNFIIH